MSNQPKKATMTPCNGVIVVAVDKQGNKYFPLVRTPKMYWSLPKGKKEKGELPLRNALRELWEETGIEEDEIDIVNHPLMVEFSDKGNPATTFIVAKLRKPINAQKRNLDPVDPEELNMAKWFTLEEINNWKDSLGKIKQRRIDLINSVQLDLVFPTEPKNQSDVEIEKNTEAD